MADGYGASNNGRFGYGAIPPGGVSADSTLEFLNGAYKVNKRPPKPERMLVYIRNLSNTLIILQPVTQQRSRVIENLALRIGPRQKAIISLEDYDGGQISNLRKQGLISVERIS